MSLTPEQKAEVDKLVVDALKTALTGPEFKTVLTSIVTPALEGATKPLTEKIATLEAGAKKPADPPPGKKEGEGAPGIPAEVTAQLKALQDQVKAEQDARKAAERAALKDRATGAVRDALGKAGVPSDRMDLAISWVESNGLVKLADDGSFHFEGAEQYGVKPKLDAAAWAGEFIKTNVGKQLLPAAPTQGAGGQPGQHGGGNAGQVNSVNQLLGFAPN